MSTHWCGDLWIGVIFQLSDIRQNFRERLKSMVKAGDMDSAVPLRIKLEIPSGPEALLRVDIGSQCGSIRC